VYIGSIYIRMSAGSPATYYTPTLPRGGLAAVFGIELFALLGTGPTLECAIEHKNQEDTSFTTAATFTSMSSAGMHTKDATALKEQIRLAITVGGSAATNTAYANVLAPQWRPY
jgi:hypothetical protein